MRAAAATLAEARRATQDGGDWPVHEISATATNTLKKFFQTSRSFRSAWHHDFGETAEMPTWRMQLLRSHAPWESNTDSAVEKADRALKVCEGDLYRCHNHNAHQLTTCFLVWQLAWRYLGSLHQQSAADIFQYNIAISGCTTPAQLAWVLRQLRTAESQTGITGGIQADATTYRNCHSAYVRCGHLCTIVLCPRAV